MNRFVWNAFKGVALAMIFVFVWDMGFYLFRTANLNQRMLLLTGSMVKTVEANNYMPASQAANYETIMRGIATTMNNDPNAEPFVLGYNWNYTANNSGFTEVWGLDAADFKQVMGTPANYGDVMLVWVEVGVNSPVWSFRDNGNGNASEMNRLDYNLMRLDYRYLVPCLHYVKQGTN